MRYFLAGEAKGSEHDPKRVLTEGALTSQISDEVHAHLCYAYIMNCQI